MAEVNYTTKVVKRCRISPPEGSVPTTHLPLSFFDMLWIICPPMRRFFFYQVPYSTNHFMDAIFPTLKRSLSLALQHFFPLAGNLILPPQLHKNKPHILYTTHDSVPLTVAESIGSDFNLLLADYPNAKHFYPLVPDLPNSRVFPDGSRALPLLAIQITLFPNRGLCICVAFHHVVADGMAAHHFFKSWASIQFHTNGRASEPRIHGPLPYHDRTTVNHPNRLHLESIFLRELSGWASSWNPALEKPITALAPVDKVRATFVLTKTQIQTFKTWVSDSAQPINDRELEPNLRVSAFIVTCSLIWSCLIKSTTESEESCCGDEDEMCYLGFVADCRNRLKDPIPPTYFGNCLDMCVVGLKKEELLKGNNIVGVVKAIGDRVKELEREPLEKAEEWFSDWRRCEESGRLITIAGSPKLKVYETEFGWGRPHKSEILHVDSSKAVSLQESRDDEAGIEIGLALSKSHMDRFIDMWEENLKLFSS